VPRREDRHLRQQHHVAPLEVNVLVWRVEGRRFTAYRPVIRRIDVAHVDAEYGQWHDRRGRRGGEYRGQETLGHHPLIVLPREPGADVNGLSGTITADRIEQQDGTVEPR
jgi:hypothetical protein